MYTSNHLHLFHHCPLVSHHPHRLYTPFAWHDVHMALWSYQYPLLSAVIDVLLTIASDQELLVIGKIISTFLRQSTFPTLYVNIPGTQYNTIVYIPRPSRTLVYKEFTSSNKLKFKSYTWEWSSFTADSSLGNTYFFRSKTSCFFEFGMLQNWSKILSHRMECWINIAVNVSYWHVARYKS